MVGPFVAIGNRIARKSPHLAATLRWTVGRLFTSRTSWIAQEEHYANLTAVKAMLEKLSQRAVYLKEELRAGLKENPFNQYAVPTYDDTSESSRAMREELEEIERQFFYINRHYQRLYALERPAELMMRHYDAVYKTRVLGRESLRQACIANGGCCARSCGCCEKPRKDCLWTEFQHCSSACGCCRRVRGFDIYNDVEIARKTEELAREG